MSFSQINRPIHYRRTQPSSSFSAYRHPNRLLLRAQNAVHTIHYDLHLPRRMILHHLHRGEVEELPTEQHLVMLHFSPRCFSFLASKEISFQIMSDLGVRRWGRRDDCFFRHSGIKFFCRQKKTRMQNALNDIIRTSNDWASRKHVCKLLGSPHLRPSLYHLNFGRYIEEGRK